MIQQLYIQSATDSDNTRKHTQNLIFCVYTLMGRVLLTCYIQVVASLYCMYIRMYVYAYMWLCITHGTSYI